MIHTDRYLQKMVEYLFFYRFCFFFVLVAWLLDSPSWSTGTAQWWQMVLPVAAQGVLSALYFVTRMHSRRYVFHYNGVVLVADVLVLASFINAMDPRDTTYLYAVFGLQIVWAGLFLSLRGYLLYCSLVFAVGIWSWRSLYIPYLRGLSLPQEVLTRDLITLVLVAAVCVAMGRVLQLLFLDVRGPARQGESAADAAHEMRTTLNALCRLVHLHLPRNDTAKEEIMARLEDIENLLGDYEGLRTQGAVNRKRTNLSLVVKSSIEDIRYVMDEMQHVAVKLCCPLRDRYALVDVDNARKIVRNLVKNAMEAAAERDDGTVTIGLEDCGFEWVKVSVEDNGAGIPRSRRRNLILGRGRTTKGMRGGAGLGLSIVQNLVEANNGLLFVKSKKCMGTNFTVLFRTADQEDCGNAVRSLE